MGKQKVQKGQQYGRLTIVECQGKNSQRQIICKCVCECGEEKVLASSRLLSGNTKSCGCLRRENSKKIRWAGCGEISGQYFGNLRKGAEKRGLSFNIEIEHVWQLFLEQDRKCSLTGVDLEFRPTTRSEKLGTASLDRIDSSMGYDVGNVHWVHKDINRMKWEFSQDRFMELCRLVVEHEENHD